MSLHSDATRVLRSWRAPNSDQERLRRDYLAYLAAHADAMWRRCRPAHLTASALVVDPTGGRVLLVRHSKIGRWLQTGGHCEPGDATLADAALREATEETGISELRLLPRPVQLDRHPASCGATHHLDVQFVAFADRGEPSEHLGPVPLPRDHLWAPDDRGPASLPRDHVGTPDDHGSATLPGDHSDPVAWFPADQLPAETDDSVRRLVIFAQTLVS